MLPGAQPVEPGGSRGRRVQEFLFRVEVEIGGHGPPLQLRHGRIELPHLRDAAVLFLPTSRMRVPFLVYGDFVSSLGSGNSRCRFSLVFYPVKWFVESVDAERTLGQLAKSIGECRLEVVLIGNAAAALQGAPVTTLDFDFMFRKTASNLIKLKRLADRVGGQILRPYYPSSGLYRLMVEDSGLQLDFMSVIHGIRSFAALRSRATEVRFHGHPLWVADLRDILRSKKAANRPRDRAVLEILEKAIEEKDAKKKGA